MPLQHTEKMETWRVPPNERKQKFKLWFFNSCSHPGFNALSNVLCFICDKRFQPLASTCLSFIKRDGLFPKVIWLHNTFNSLKNYFNVTKTTGKHAKTSFETQSMTNYCFCSSTKAIVFWHPWFHCDAAIFRVSMTSGEFGGFPVVKS